MTQDQSTWKLRGVFLEDEQEEKTTKAELNLEFIDSMFIALLHKKKDPKVEEHWRSTMNRNPQYAMILENRPRMSSRRLAEQMGITTAQLAQMEQEIFQAYYYSSGRAGK